QLGLRRCPEVRLVPGRVAPMLWAGGGRPLLLLPERLAEHLGGDRLDTVLTHELAHLRRRDHWVRRLEFVALGLYWWLPVAGLAFTALGGLALLLSPTWATAQPGPRGPRTDGDPVEKARADLKKAEEALKKAEADLRDAERKKGGDKEKAGRGGFAGGAPEI